jgi:enterochelin esterase-like enzyme
MRADKTTFQYATALLAVAGLTFALSGAGAQQASTESALPTSVQNLSNLPLLVEGARGGDFTVKPPYTVAPELSRDPAAPVGSVYHFVMSSTVSRFYPGISKTAPGKVVPYHRRVTVYIPAQYKAGKPAPFLVSQDSMGDGMLPTILDNMIYEHRLPVMAAIMIDSGGGDAQGSERGLEYDTVSGKYADFIEKEVLPEVSRRYHITLTHDPDGRLAMGGSSGGACALTMAWFRPNLYHRVLTYSGTYVNQQSPFNPASPHGAWEYHEHFILQQHVRPIRIWLEVGQNDLRAHDDMATLHNWPLANERMAAALRLRGYRYQFVYAQDAGHVDWRVVQQTMPEALEWVWRGYRPSGR